MAGAVDRHTAQLNVGTNGMQVSLAERRLWLVLLALAFAGAWPDFLFDRVAEPILGTLPGQIAVTCIECLVAFAIGWVGGNARSWAVTFVGLLLLLGAIQVGTMADQAVFDARPAESAATSEGSSLSAFLLLLLLVPAGIGHTVASWVTDRRQQPVSR